MHEGRFQMFQRIRRSLGAAVLPSARNSLPAAARIPLPEAGTLVETFVRELKSVGVKVLLSQNPGQVADIAIGLLQDLCSSRELLVWEDSEFPVPELGSTLQRAGFKRLDSDLPSDPELRRLKLAELGRASAGLTSAQAGLADTGTLALLSGPKRPRLASVLPPFHISILSRRAIYPSMAAYFEANPKDVLQASNLVFITGPSRTADIEQTLIVGVHGPRELVTIILED